MDLPPHDPALAVDCEGRWITPGLIDCHTHLVRARLRQAVPTLGTDRAMAPDRAAATAMVRDLTPPAIVLPGAWRPA